LVKTPDRGRKTSNRSGHLIVSTRKPTGTAETYAPGSTTSCHDTNTASTNADNTNI
jgi:hypothetical protein